MQLIFETDNPNININEKMSAVDEEKLTEKPLHNGDVKDIVEEANGKLETNGTDVGQNVQNKENILSNGDDVDSHKATEDDKSAEKPLVGPSLREKSDEIEDFIAAHKPLECSSAEENKEAKEVLQLDELEIRDLAPAAETEETGTDFSESKPQEASFKDGKIKEVTIKDSEVLTSENPAEQCLPAERIKGSEDFEPVEKSPDKSLPAAETKVTSYHILAEKPVNESSIEENHVDESLPIEETKESADIKSKENSAINSASVEKNAPVEQELKTCVEEKAQVDLGTAEQNVSDDRQSLDEEMAELEKKIEEPFETLSEKPVQTQNGSHQNAEDGTEKVGTTKSAQDKSEAMDVDENDIKTNEFENISEHDVSLSMSDMVDNIVQNLTDDAADNLMVDIEVEKNENVKPTAAAEIFFVENINGENILNNLTNKNEIGNFQGQLDNSASNLVKKDHTNMELDEEPNVNTIDRHTVTVEKKEIPLDDTSTTTQTSVVTQEDEASQKPVDTTNFIVSENNAVEINEIREVSQNSINDDMNEPDSSINNIVQVNNDKTNESSVSTLKETENKDIRTDNSDVIELKSGDSSANSSFAKEEDDIVSLINKTTEKKLITTNKETLEPPVNDVQVAGETVLEAENNATDTDKTKINEDMKQISEQKNENEKTPDKVPVKSHTPLIKLSNTMDILSDDEDESSTEEPKTDPENKLAESLEKQQTINLTDDDDIMLIDEDPKEEIAKIPAEPSTEKTDELQSKTEDEPSVAKCTENETSETPTDAKTDSTKADTEVKDMVDGDVASQPEVEKPLETVQEKPEKQKPLIPADFFKTYRKNLADMTRDDLEEFCILKIVESIIDRSNLNEIRTKLKTMALTIEEYKKKAMMLTKQNRDLQVVLKSVQEEQKKSTGKQPITPLKITRSVGMQVLMTDKSRRRVMPGPGTGPNNSNNNQANNRNVRTPNQSPRNTPQKQVNNQIPVPRLVPAGMNVGKTVQVTQANITPKPTAVQNGAKNTSPALKPEKRTHSRMQSQSSSSVTVDLTDDEPPPKVATKLSPAPPVRLVNQQNLLAPRQQFAQQVNSPRKVYIPISINGPQAQTTRPGQTIMLKTVGQGPRPRGPNTNTTVVRAPQNMQGRKVVGSRHPAPLPDAMKQYQPPNWKALPPAPDLKLSKVENGIVISWKIEGYQEDSYEEIASYQLYAYQETSAPASTSLWKKIGDVKALPLPMACTLTQFMAGYKYYFAVRAVDIRSRLGPFSLPGSILLLNKM
ncbi:hypothetical protein O0L34_g16699 [Tuta absoluta]|nr:hypothetical protein O0L34_g16699 [Tuta absoluta]